MGIALVALMMQIFFWDERIDGLNLNEIESHFYVTLTYLFGYYIFFLGWAFLLTVCNLCDSCKEERRSRETETTFTKISRAFDPFKFSELTECVICLEDFKKEDMVTALPCDHRHYFHTHCIQEWSAKQRTCPLCKAEYSLK